MSEGFTSRSESAEISGTRYFRKCFVGLYVHLFCSWLCFFLRRLPLSPCFSFLPLQLYSSSSSSSSSFLRPMFLPLFYFYFFYFFLFFFLFLSFLTLLFSTPLFRILLFISLYSTDSSPLFSPFLIFLLFSLLFFLYK